MMQSRRGQTNHISSHDVLFKTAVRRGIEGVRRLYFPAFVIVAFSIPLLIWTHNLFVSKPYDAWLLLIPFSGKSPYLALAGVVFVFIGGVLGLVRGRWLRDFRMLAFISGCVTAALLAWMLDVILKVFSLSANPEVHFLIRHPSGLLLGLPAALLLGLIIGFLGYLVVLVPAYFIWRKPVSQTAGLAKLAVGLVLLPAGVYFALLFNPTWVWFFRFSNSGAFAVTIRVVATISILAGATLIFRSSVALIAKHRIAYSSAVFILLVTVFLAQVELFGLWLRNDDFVYAFMNRMFADVSSIKSGSQKDSAYDLLLPAPLGNRILKIEIAENNLFATVYSVLDNTGRTVSVIRPPGLTPLPGQAMWSPDGTHVIGIGRKSPKSTSPPTVLWSYCVDDDRYQIADNGIAGLLLNPYGWSVDGKTFAAFTSDQDVWLGVYRGQYFDAFIQPEHRPAAISLVDAATLEIKQRVEVQGLRPMWICFLDKRTILFQKRISNGRNLSPRAVHTSLPMRMDQIGFAVDEEEQIALVKKDLLTGQETQVNTRLGPATATLTTPGLVRDRKWILTAMSDKGKVVPLLVELATGKIEEVRGLEKFKPSPHFSSVVPVLWEYSVTDRAGLRAAVPMYKASSLWPHSEDQTICIWEDGKGFKEFLPRLTHKDRPILEAPGSLDFYWDDDYQRYEFTGESKR